MKWSTSPAAPLQLSTQQGLEKEEEDGHHNICQKYEGDKNCWRNVERGAVASSGSPNLECGTCSILDVGGSEGTKGFWGVREERAEGKGQGGGLGVEFTTTPAWVLEP